MKKRRSVGRCSKEQSSSTEYTGGNWSELQHDLLLLIAERFKKPEDFRSFGAVCTSWRAAAAKKNFKGLRLWQHIPCLMLGVEVENGAGQHREFYSLLENKIVAKVSFPYLKGEKFIESLGWLLGGGYRDMGLINPFSGVKIPLPYGELEKMVLSARPDETSDYVIMAISRGHRYLVFWKPGDEKWSKIETYKRFYHDVTYYNGQFYAIDEGGRVVVCNIGGSNPTQGRIITRLVPDEFAKSKEYFFNKLVDGKQLYIVGSSEALLVVARCFKNNSVYSPKTIGFKVYEIDLFGETWKEIKRLGIGSRAIFLGHSATTVMEASTIPKIKGNHIYFIDDNWKRHNSYIRNGYRYSIYYVDEGDKGMGIYSLKTKNIEPFYKGEELFRRISQSIWFTPSLQLCNNLLSF